MRKLYVFFQPYRNHTSIIVATSEKPFENVEIHGISRQEIAIALLNNYPLKLAMDSEPCVVVNPDNDVFGTLRAIQELKRPIRRDEEFRRLLENPTLENVRRFISLKKLLEE